MPDAFWIGDWRAQVSTNRLTRNDDTVRLEPRAMKVLAQLALNAGETVSREDLEKEVWRGRVVGYECLSNTIAILRKTFKDDPQNAKFIETIPKVGYRLIAPVTPSESDVQLLGEAVSPERGARKPIYAAALVALVGVLTVAGWFSLPAPQRGPLENGTGNSSSQIERPSVAVMPFKNMSEGSLQEYFSDGITDDLITDLSKISGLSVIARNSSFAYKGTAMDVRDISRALGVRYLLEGSVRKSEEQIRINAQLVDAATGVHFWAERYDGTLDDVFKFQDQVTRNIVAALKVRLTAREQSFAAEPDTENAAAYDAFLKGWAHQLRKTPEDAVRAIAYFTQAVQLDPDYSRAYAAMAQTYWNNRDNATFNMLTDPSSTELSNTGYRSYLDTWKFLRKALAKPSSQAHALAAKMLQRQRRFDEAIEEARLAVTLGPNDPGAYDALIEILIYAGKTPEALKLIHESIRIDPRLPGEKLFLRGLAHYASGQLNDALPAIERARRHNPDQTRYAAVQAAVLSALGRREEANVALREYLSGWTTYTTLNWIMFTWPFQNITISERLATGLMEAGLPAPLNLYYRVTDDHRLTGAEIRSLIADKLMIGADRSYFGEAEFEVSRDRSGQIERQGFLTYFDDGESRIEDDLLCDPWHLFGEYCVAIFRNPDGSRGTRSEYLFFTFMGAFSFSVFPREHGLVDTKMVVEN